VDYGAKKDAAMINDYGKMVRDLMMVASPVADKFSPTKERLNPLATTEGAKHHHGGGETCYACGKKMRGRSNDVVTSDNQAQCVGSDCLKHIRRGGAEGFQPKRGGPRLYLPDFKKAEH
jgi:uncharacterized protein (DUF169 family)